MHGKLSDKRLDSRPPWALGKSEFDAHCSRCGDCIASCPQKILTKDADGFPVVDFGASGCSFCAACVDSCKTGSLSLMAFIGIDPWNLKAVVMDSCVNHNGIVCQQCMGACSNRAIEFRVTGAATAPEIDWAACTGCGECYRHCPVTAIRIISYEPRGVRGA